MHTMEKPQAIQMAMPLSIPPISDTLLEQLTNSISPVVMHQGALHYIEPVNPRRTAFTWHPSITKEAKNLEVVAQIPTLHVYGAPKLFKPTIAEVLAQIPAGYIDSVAAFQTNCSHESIDNWSDAEHLALNWGYQLATTTLYNIAK